MALIKTVNKEEATGTIKEGYEMFEKIIGLIPKPFELLSASPGLFSVQLQRNRYFGKHPRLGFALLAHIRYLASRSIGNTYCIDFNKLLLNRLGVTDDLLAKMEQDPSQSMLEEHENAMLSFVVNAMKNPGTTTAEELEKLRELGWEDGDMVDALAQGVGMIDIAILMKTFQMEEHCLMQ